MDQIRLAETEASQEWSEAEHRSCDRVQGLNPLMSPFTSIRQLNRTAGRYSHGLFPLPQSLHFGAAVEFEPVRRPIRPVGLPS